uniref:riboflavin kinase n=1 Tax=Wuchereria bancrofti TaxID=6293 RepID=A0A1I8EEL9_WUCBA
MNDSNRDRAVGDSTDDPYPYYFRGTVVVGFGRGGRKLGCPTANMDDNVISCLPPYFPCGVFYGFANVNHGEVYGMVTSIGWNPHFKNERKTIEVHILHDFEEDFYGAEVRAVLVGFLRPMAAFDSLGYLFVFPVLFILFFNQISIAKHELKTAINNDVALAESLLSAPEMMVYKNSNFFSQ